MSDGLLEQVDAGETDLCKDERKEEEAWDSKGPTFSSWLTLNIIAM